MKEWGMLSYPRQGVQLPSHSLNDWARSGQASGQGLAGALQGAESPDAADDEAEIASGERELGTRDRNFCCCDTLAQCEL